ncbi:HAD family hydrolase [Thermoproteus tenax]|uniref:HAD superfamily hydrolase n=1 Tax=Thermoproteus tenax (strain ATCC 35583 / DSM 2078 / JCM 9277 / NBRC 100435 / Kra 1) TaxID=768679 RepID=G4RKN6_THETK|nr:HAD family hydrolase [Thermoproteus tenax]CCC82131.1 HAD superfamily hydrolase [Thermoproteus tenax Kra 1]
MTIALVDLDGTLIPLEAWDPVFYELSSIIASRAGVEPQDVWGLVKALHYQLMRRFDPKAFDWQYLFESVGSSLGIFDIPNIEDILLKYVDNFPVNEGAFELLRDLRSLGLSPVIATNGLYRYQHIVVERLGFSKYVDGVRTSDAYGCTKSCSRFFEGASLVIGDNPIFDVYFPKKFGVATIFIGEWNRAVRKYSELLGIDAGIVRPDYIAADLIEARAVVARFKAWERSAP